MRRRSELHWPGLRSVYCWHPPGGGVTVSGAQQIGVSFAEHRGVVTESAGRRHRFDIRIYAGSAPRRAPAGRLDRVLLGRVADVVEDRLGDQLTVGDLAAAATLSPFHFARAFKASTGLAPHEYVTSRRVERAKSLLLNSRLSVPEVAYAVGLSNVSHFRRLFRRHTGLLPSDLRPARTAGSDPPGRRLRAAGSAA